MGRLALCFVFQCSLASVHLTDDQIPNNFRTENTLRKCGHDLGKQVTARTHFVWN